MKEKQIEVMAPVEKVEKGDVFSIPVDVKIRPSDKLFNVVDR